MIRDLSKCHIKIWNDFKQHLSWWSTSERSKSSSIVYPHQKFFIHILCRHYFLLDFDPAHLSILRGRGGQLDIRGNFYPEYPFGAVYQNFFGWHWTPSEYLLSTPKRELLSSCEFWPLKRTNTFNSVCRKQQREYRGSLIFFCLLSDAVTARWQIGVVCMTQHNSKDKHPRK